MRRVWAAAGAVAVLMGVVAACGTGTEHDFPGQTISWQPCPDQSRPQLRTLECAKVSVPLDYRDPRGERIEIAVSRIPAKGAAARIGALVVNPGGPGGGRDISIPSALAHPTLLARYDWVGYDPRGVGESSPVRCLEPAESADLLLNGDPPRTDDDWRAATAEAGRFVQACRSRSGRVADLVGVANSARDLDVLRAALGEQRLSVFGR